MSAQPMRGVMLVATIAACAACGTVPTVREDSWNELYYSTPKASPAPTQAPPPAAPVRDASSAAVKPEPVRYADTLDQDLSVSDLKLGDPPSKLDGKAKAAIIDRGDGSPARPLPGTFERKEAKVFGTRVVALTYVFTDERLTNMKLNGSDWKTCQALRAAFTARFGAPSTLEVRDGVNVSRWVGHKAKLVLEQQKKTCSASLSTG